VYIDAEFTVLYTLSTCKDVALAQVPAMVDLGSTGYGPSHAERIARSVRIMTAQSLHPTCHEGSVSVKAGREAVSVMARQLNAARRGCSLRKTCHEGYSLLPVPKER